MNENQQHQTERRSSTENRRSQNLRDSTMMAPKKSFGPSVSMFGSEL
jgi:hypothetical protein